MVIHIQKSDINITMTDKDDKNLTPLEAYFETEPTYPEFVDSLENGESQELVEEVERVASELFDEKDNEIEDNFHRIYEIAMIGYEAVMTELDSAPPEQVHKLATAAQKHLTTALDAIKQKSALKSHKDKIHQAEQKQKRNTQDDAIKVMANRNELLRQMMDESKTDEDSKIPKKSK